MTYNKVLKIFGEIDLDIFSNKISKTKRGRKTQPKPINQAYQDVFQDFTGFSDDLFGNISTGITKPNFVFRPKIKKVRRQNHIRLYTIPILRKLAQEKQPLLEPIFYDLRTTAYEEIIKRYKNRTIKLFFTTKILDSSDKFSKEKIIDMKEKGAKEKLYVFLLVDSDVHIFDNPEYDQQKLYIFTQEKIKIPFKKLEQKYSDGSTHCLLYPIKIWAEDKRDDSKTVSTERRYNTIINKVDLLIGAYKQGIPDSDLQKVSDKLQIGLKIDLPSTIIRRKIDYINIIPDKKPLTTFNYINTRLNHVEHIFNINNKNIEINRNELELKLEQNMKDDKIVFYKKNGDLISQLYTPEGVYTTSNDSYLEATKDLKLNSCRVDYNTETELSDFLFSNINRPSRKSFLKEYDLLEGEERPIDYDNLEHIDIKKSYATSDTCKYYDGFLGKITDFRPTNKIQGIGIYTIDNLDFKNCSYEIIDKLQYLYNGNAYPSVELKFISKLGVKFNITGGCWGEKIDITIPQEMYEKDKDGVAHYKRWYGCLMKDTRVDRYYFKCNNIEEAQLNAYANKEATIRYNFGCEEGLIEYPKKYVYHLVHIAIFIHGYNRIRMLEQLIKFKDVNQIKAIDTDGIYYRGDVEILTNYFTNKELKNLKYICVNSTYGEESNYIIKKQKLKVKNHILSYFFRRWYDIIEEKFGNYYTYNSNFRENNLIEFHKGAGGTGKTHKLLTDSGLINKLFVAPCYKLARVKETEYNIDATVLNKLLYSDKFIDYYNKYNVLIFDECSMMNTTEKKEIIKKFNRHKIFFVGDFRHQLPPIEGEEIKPENFKYNIVEHNINYRCKCQKLKKILDELRYRISKDEYYFNIRDFKFKTIKLKDIQYSPEDIIITVSNKKKDIITDQFKHLNKFVVLENTQTYSNTQILLQKPEGVKSELRHGFTIYSVQGETAKHKLFIDVSKIKDLRTIYTAISRAEYLHNIIFFE